MAPAARTAGRIDRGDAREDADTRPRCRSGSVRETGAGALPGGGRLKPLTTRPGRHQDAPLPVDAALAATEAAPRNHGWLYRAPGEGRTLLWIVVIHVLAVAGIVLFPAPGWPVFAAALGLTWLGGLGTAVACHRALAHRSVRLARPVEAFLTVFAVPNGSGAPASWTANHRLHHA